MPSYPTEERNVAMFTVATTPSIYRWLKARAKAEDRSVSGVVRYVLLGLYNAEVEDARPAKELIG
jgi:hypothetical protein